MAETIRFSGGALEYTSDGFCDTCSGERVIANLQWRRFALAHPEVIKLLCEFFQVSSWRQLPHVEYTCPACDGTGREPSRASGAYELDIPF